jgi:PRTRC genetic system ThiF family protein
MTTILEKQAVHFTDKDLIARVNPIIINLIGVGGTGSHVLSSLADMNEALISLGHSGLEVRTFDEDKVSIFNLARQRFARSEVGLSKAEAKINRINRSCGTYWKAMVYPFSSVYESRLQEFLAAQITISCVDTVTSRFDIERILRKYLSNEVDENQRDRPLYWMDFGNGRYTGQVLLATLADIKQPDSELYAPVSKLPWFTEEYRISLKAVNDRNEPSCSHQEALTKQDLFINPTLAQHGCRLLWTLITEGMTTCRGVFVNVKDFKVAPIPITLAESTQLLPSRLAA